MSDIKTRFDIRAFSAKISETGVSRSNRYIVHIPVATLIKNAAEAAKLSGWTSTTEAGTVASYFDDLCPSSPSGLDARSMDERLSFFCKKAELPGMSYAIEETRFYGEAFKTPSLPIYNDITLSFLVGADMLERFFFDAWMYTIMDPQSHDFNYMVDYAVDIDISQFNEVGDADGLEQITYAVRLYDAWPTNINQMDLSYDSDNQIHEVAVTFAYRRYLPLGLGFNGTTGAPMRGRPESLPSTIRFQHR